MLKASKVIKKLKLQLNNDEGGYFASTYPLPSTKNPPCSAIYYFLEKKRCSVLHRVTGDMLYHFYCGDPVEMLLLYPKGHIPQTEVCIFSNDLEEAGGISMKVIPGGTWLGSRVKKGGSYTLMGVTMAPAFDIKDYSLGDRNNLIKEYPGQKELIIALTPKPKKQDKK